MRLTGSAAQAGGSAIILVVLVVLWQIAVMQFEIPAFVLPAPTAIVEALVDSPDVFLEHTIVTTQEIIIGFVVGSALGLFLALVMDRFAAIRNTLYPLVIATQTVPKVAIAPLLVIWFGVGMTPKIIVVALLAFFPVLINAIVGFHSVQRNLIELLKSVNASESQEYWHVRFPAALPYIFAGLKLAITISVVGAVVGEWIAAQEGLGYLVLYYNSVLDVPKAFATVLLLVMLGVVTFAAIAILERQLSWEARIGQSTGKTTIEVTP